MASRGVPPRWKNCPRYGDLVSNIFIPLKVPLDEKYSSLIAPQSLFTPHMFISFFKNRKIDIGLWIDLTYTDRFYDQEFIKQQGIGYCKFRCRGHGECPSKEQVSEFIGLCEGFSSRNPQSKIAIHCTHGFNRTGFLICAYLVESQDWTIDAAIAAFSKARPPGIYKQDYLDELNQRYADSDTNQAVFIAPLLPEWCHEDEQFNDDQTCPAPDINSSETQCLEGINDIVYVSDQDKIRTLQKTCQEMCKFRLRGFPGCQPVSLTQKNIGLLRQEKYMVSWKADGTRYMMLILGKDQVYFFDRDFSVYQIFNLNFLRRSLKEYLTGTLLDGELVIDVVKEVRTPRFLIYDIVYCDGQAVSEITFDQRLNIIFKQVICPREEAKKQRLIDRNAEPIGVRIKDFCEMKKTFKYFEPKFQQNLVHEIDGLIFQPIEQPYLSGRCDKVLKWKPPSHNSIDFQLRIVEETRPGMLEKYIGQLFVGGLDRPYAYIRVTNDLKKYDRKIIECRYNARGDKWEFMRERTDKSYPNALSTAENVVFSIKHPITREYLLDFIMKYSR